MNPNAGDPLLPPEDDPLPRTPLFGVGRPAEATLPARDVVEYGDQPRSLFNLRRDMTDLGLTVRLAEQLGDRAGELWAIATCTDPDRYGHDVHIGLIGEDDAIKRVVVKLTEVRADAGVGETRVGTIEEIREELGENLTLSAFFF